MAVDQHGEPIKGLCDMWSAGVVRRPRTKQLGPRGPRGPIKSDA